MDLPTLLQSLSALDVPVTAADLNKPEPALVQRLYRTILIRFFGIPEMSLQQPDYSWVTLDMQKDPDLYSRSEGFLLLTRFLQCILNDYTNVADDVAQFGVGSLVDPKPRETKLYLSQLMTIAKLKQASRPFYDAEEAHFQEQLARVKQEEDRAVQLEARLERLTQERAARLRLDENLCRQKEEREAALAALTHSSTETEQRLEAAGEHLQKLSNAVVSKRAEEAAARRKATELDYDLVDDPEELRNKVEKLRAHKIDQQRLLDGETRDCRELEQRDEQCRQASKVMGAIEGEMGVATKTVARLNEALGEMHEKQAVLEELQDLLASKKEGVAKKKEEREAFRQRHQEEKREQAERLLALSSRIAAIKGECDRLKSLEGEVKKSVLEQRAKLARLRNEKNAVIAELTEYVQARVGLLQKLETKMEEKKAHLRALEVAYDEGVRALKEAMTTTDLDVSVTATATMQLLD